MPARNCLKLFFGSAVLLALGACASSPPAPIRNLSITPAQDLVRAAAARPRYYVVRPNDTLGGIAQRYNLRYTDIAIWNGIADPGSIRVGQILSLEPGRSSQSVSQAKTSPARRAPALAARSSSPERLASAVEVSPISLPGAPDGHELSHSVPQSATTLPAVPPATPVSPKAAPVPVAPAPVPINPQSAEVQAQDYKSSAWLWPADGPLLARFDPGPGMRHGIDIGGRMGAPVRAARAGTVLYSGSGLRGYGRLIIIRHNNNYITAYAHNAQLLASEGARVKAGQIIARMGQSGNAGRVMLHFELREQGRPKDPLAYLPPRPLSAR